MENEAGSEQQFVRIYPDATPLDNIIEEVGGRPDEFRITQIMLSITGSNIDADSTVVVTHANNLLCYSEPQLEMGNLLLSGSELEWRQVLQRPSLNHWSSALIALNRLDLSPWNLL